MNTPYDTLTVSTTNGVCLVTIDRPDVRNALSAGVLDDLQDVLDRVEDDDDVAVLILTGAGDKAFVAGADITQLQHYTVATGLEHRMQNVFNRVESFPKPTIAAVNGFALGGGCELSMACDIRVATDSARFGLPETNLGVLPGAGGTQRLARLVGTGRAIEMILTGRFIDADEALRIGLVTSVVPATELLDHAQTVAATIAAKGPLAVRLAKLVVRTGMDADLGTGQVVEHLAQAILYGSEDKTEGTAAFLGKRRAEFKGK